MAPNPNDAAAAHSESYRVEEAEEGERRHLSVLFCDVVGSTEIASKLDAEDWRSVVTGYQRALTEVVGRFGGTVTKYLGDGILALFGYPEAHENDAERAVRAGLAMLQAVDALDKELLTQDRPELAMRVGIDTGPVVIATGGGEDQDVFGDPPNIASRVQSAAEPKTVLITEAVHRLISGLFIVREYGPQKPIRLFGVIQASGVRRRFNVAAGDREVSQFVGRDEELQILQTRWKRVSERAGQVVLITGEAGIGKSRLLRRMREL